MTPENKNIHTESERRVCVKGLEHGNVVGLYFLFSFPLSSSSVPTPWKTLSSPIHPASHDVDGRLTFARVCLWLKNQITIIIIFLGSYFSSVCECIYESSLWKVINKKIKKRLKLFFKKITLNLLILLLKKNRRRKCAKTREMQMVQCGQRLGFRYAGRRRTGRVRSPGNLKGPFP